MKALIFQGLGKKALEERPKPTIVEPTDAIVTICGTDLHILKGDVPTCQPGRGLGHEGVGFIEAVGSGVVTFKPEERVLISCISACGKGEYCRKGYGTRIRSTADGFLAIPSTGHKPSMYAFPTQTRVSTESRTMSTRKRLSCYPADRL
jgi:threonine dehydrogenase-like Zn-dependent dehydrogenase